MIARRLELGARARTDLAGIWTHTDQRWGLAQAERYADQLNAAMAGLVTGSHIGHSSRVKGYDCLRAGSHMIYFRTRPTLIRVIRILHVRQAAERHLGR